MLGSLRLAALIIIHISVHPTRSGRARAGFIVGKKSTHVFYLLLGPRRGLWEDLRSDMSL